MKRFAIVCLTLFVLLAAACAQKPATETAEAPSETPVPEVTASLSLACPGQEGSVSAKWAEFFRERAETLSGGAVHITVFGGGVLGTDAEVARDCRYGSVDLMIAPTAAMSATVPECVLLDYPFLFDDTASVRRTLADERIFGYLKERCGEKGLVLLSLTDWGFENLGLSRSFASAEELEGIPVACTDDPCRQKVLFAMGFTPVTTDDSDVCLAVAQRLVVGQESTNERFYTEGICEKQKYLTDSRHTVCTGGLFAGAAVWEALDDGVKAVLTQAAAECTALVADYADEVNETLLGSMMKMGIRVIGLDTVPGLRAGWKEKAQRTARDYIVSVCGEEIADVLVQTAGAAE